MKVKVLKWVSPSFKYTFKYKKYTFNCKYKYKYKSFKYTFNCSLIQLIPANKIFRKTFFFFSGVKITEAHYCSRAHIVQAGITARIWVALSNELNKFGRMFVVLVWVNINYLIMKMKYSLCWH